MTRLLDALGELIAAVLIAVLTIIARVRETAVTRWANETNEDDRD